MRSHLKPLALGTFAAVVTAGLTAPPALAGRDDYTYSRDRSSSRGDDYTYSPDRSSRGEDSRYDRSTSSFDQGYDDGRDDARRMRDRGRMSSRSDNRDDDRFDSSEYSRGYEKGSQDQSRHSGGSTSVRSSSPDSGAVAVLVVERDRQRAAMQQLRTHLQEARAALQSGDQQKAQQLINTADQSVQNALGAADIWQKVDKHLQTADQALSSNNNDEAQRALRQARMELSGRSGTTGQSSPAGQPNQASQSGTTSSGSSR